MTAASASPACWVPSRPPSRARTGASRATRPSSRSGCARSSVTQTLSSLSISLDGFVAGPDQSLNDPLGVGGMRLHQWVFETAEWARREGLEPRASTPDSEVLERTQANMGAFVMGRHMFSPGRGEWDMSWRGWGGEDPPYHTPVFVLTHHPRPPLP